MLLRTRRRWPALVVGLLATLLWSSSAAAPATAAPTTARPATAAPATLAGAGTASPWDTPCYFTGVCLYRETSGALTAWSLYDVGPTPYYYSIFNVTTHVRLTICGTGTSCSTGIYIAPTPGKCWTYVAYVGGSGVFAPPPPVQRQSAPFTLCTGLG